MRDTKTTAVGLRSAIERSGYYPGLVADAVFSALGAEAVVSYVVQADALFDPAMEVRRHMTVLVLTPSRLVYSHTDENPADDEPGARPQAETSTEAVRFSRDFPFNAKWTTPRIRSCLASRAWTSFWGQHMGFFAIGFSPADPEGGCTAVQEMGHGTEPAANRTWE